MVELQILKIDALEINDMLETTPTPFILKSTNNTLVNSKWQQHAHMSSTRLLQGFPLILC